MATSNRALPPYIVTGQQWVKRCQRCNAEIVWQQSRRTGRNYATEVQRDTLGNLITARNWFHQCKPVAPQPAQQQPTLFEKAFNVAGLLDLFAKAKAHLKWPKIRLSTPTGQVVVLKLAGAQSRHTGDIQITDGEPYGRSKYFGRIDQQGGWHPGRDSGDEVVSLLNRLSEDPAGVAAAYGKLTGNCCFCNLPLSDQRSTDVGYGPICAQHFGLPWG